MSTYVRIQDRKYGTEGLFDADRLSWDMGMCDDNARCGVSCCDDLEALLDYYVQAPIEIGDDEGDVTDALDHALVPSCGLLGPIQAGFTGLT